MDRTDGDDVENEESISSEEEEAADSDPEVETRVMPKRATRGKYVFRTAKGVIGYTCICARISLRTHSMIYVYIYIYMRV